MSVPPHATALPATDLEASQSLIGEPERIEVPHSCPPPVGQDSHPAPVRYPASVSPVRSRMGTRTYSPPPAAGITSCAAGDGTWGTVGSRFGSAARAD